MELTIYQRAIHYALVALDADFQALVDAADKLEAPDAEQACGIILARIAAIQNRVNECCSVITNFSPDEVEEARHDIREEANGQ